MPRAVKYVAVLIGLYLVTAKATGAGNVLKSAGSAGSGFVKTLQGR